MIDEELIRFFAEGTTADTIPDYGGVTRHLALLAMLHRLKELGIIDFRSTDGVRDTVEKARVACRACRRTAYTLGFAENYNEALGKATPGDPVLKSGAHDDYGGGWIWATAEDALSFRNSPAFPRDDPHDFGVYEIKLPSGWEEDVTPEPDPSDGVHRLLHDAPVIRWVL